MREESSMTGAAPSNHTSILVRIPTPLRRLTGGQGEVTAEGRSVQEVLEALERQFPGVKERLYDETGQLRRFVNIYVNDEDIRFAQGVETTLKKGDELSIVPAIAGGSRGMGASEDEVPIPHGPPHQTIDPGRGGIANPEAMLLGNSSADPALDAGGAHSPLQRPMGQSNGARGGGASEDALSLPDGPPHQMESSWRA
jgi:molybdopterin synthase sulfur carrier subunit